MTTTSDGAPFVKNHEWQYNPRISTANVEQYHDRAAELSQRYRHARPDFIADVAYGGGDDETLDIFPARENAPAHLFVHGGYWRGRDKRDYSFLAEPLNREGVTVLIANYSLCPKVAVSDIVEQTSRCLHALPDLAERYGFDRDRVTASGHSAGAHLLVASLFSVDSSKPAIRTIKAATLISGIYELAPILDISINDTIGLKPKDVGRISPMRQQPETDIVLDIIVGGQESPGWIAQSALFAEKCQTAGTLTEFLVDPAENHFSIMEKYGLSQHPLFRRLLRLAISG